MNPASPISRPVNASFDEEAARAELYGLLADLFYAPPNAEQYAALQVAVTEAPVAGGFLQEPWRDFVGVARQMPLADIRAEFEALFGGVGKPEILPYGSHYLAGFLNEKPLARLRTDLAELGLTRDERMAETEDHLAYLCEVMRYLIAGDDAAVANLTRQQAFFTTHVQPWVGRLCDDLAAHPKARYFAALGALTVAFMQVEAQGFDLMS